MGGPPGPRAPLRTPRACLQGPRPPGCAPARSRACACRCSAEGPCLAGSPVLVDRIRANSRSAESRGSKPEAGSGVGGGGWVCRFTGEARGGPAERATRARAGNGGVSRGVSGRGGRASSGPRRQVPGVSELGAGPRWSRPGKGTGTRAEFREVVGQPVQGIAAPGRTLVLTQGERWRVMVWPQCSRSASGCHWENVDEMLMAQLFPHRLSCLPQDHGAPDSPTVSESSSFWHILPSPQTWVRLRPQLLPLVSFAPAFSSFEPPQNGNVGPMVPGLTCEISIRASRGSDLCMD